jgi:2-hydroxy-3-oxopropionate reductase
LRQEARMPKFSANLLPHIGRIAKGSTVLDAKAPLVLDRKFNPGFRISLHIKDLQNVLDTSHELGVPLPRTAAVMEIMQAPKVDDKGDNDHGG